MGVVVIPARGGSKRIPRKNIRSFHGRPLIAWAIETARRSDAERVVVSTDDAEIAAIARDWGAEIPFLRDPALADDHAGTIEVIRDAVLRLGVADADPVCCLYATAALITPDDLSAGLDALRRSGAGFVFPVVDFGPPIERAYRLSDGRLRPDRPEAMPMRSQDLPKAYFDAGQFYWAEARSWRDPAAHVWDDAAPLVIDRDRVQDIDDEADWVRAERLFAALRR